MDERSVQVEREKSIVDYLRHLTTLSTGSLVLLSGFMERLFTNPQQKFLVVVSVIGFMISVLSCVVALTLLTFTMGLTKEDTKKSIGVSFDIATVGAWAGFLAGIISLTIFALVNFM
jgi:hypothetical protein